LVTNGPSDLQREKLSCLGISTSFAAIAISGEHRAAKPDPAIFMTALTQLGVEAHEAWHVGDSLDHDIAGAHASGLLAVWLNRNLTPSAGVGLFQPSSPAQVVPEGQATPDLTVSALEEITALLLEAKP
jgi:FMN phosphatase YigB (HAD superfamily)